MNIKKELAWMAVWAIAFAYMEASVVVYLRKIYYPHGFVFPIVLANMDMAAIEMFRELATLVIMWATVNLTYRYMQSKVAAYLVIFGIWDIFYYIFLKILLNWPESFFTWDILFLIPFPWVGPVWAPILVSCALIYFGITVLYNNSEGRFFYFDRKFIFFEIISALIIIVSFLIPGYSALDQSIPLSFPWYLFFVGFITGLASFLYQVKNGNFKESNNN